MGYCPSDLATNGCVAYDYSLQQEVLFMTIPLCLLADSPMAAEFTNTPIPGSSNNPCRICHLKCPQGNVKSTLNYMQKFFGNPQLPECRKWCETISRTKELWNISQEKTHNEFERMHKEYGLRGKINFELIDLKNKRYDQRWASYATRSVSIA